MKRLDVALEAMWNGQWEEIRDVAEAQIALLRAQALRWVRPLGEFVQVKSDRPGMLPRLSPSQQKTCDRLASAVRRATRYGIFRPLCLTRAVALSRMLDSHGIVGHQIRIGVSRDRGSFTAHAWIELEHTVLGDSPANTRRYALLTQISVTGNPTFSGIARRVHLGPHRAVDGLKWDQ